VAIAVDADENAKHDCDACWLRAAAAKLVPHLHRRSRIQQLADCSGKQNYGSSMHCERLAYSVTVARKPQTVTSISKQKAG
jgi:hypothetical protein